MMVATIAVLVGAATSAAANPLCRAPGLVRAPDDVPANSRHHALAMAGTAGAVAGARYYDLGPLSALVARYGYAPFRSTAAVAGFDLYANLGPVRLGLEAAGGRRSSQRLRPSQELALDSFDVSFLLGYDVLRDDDASVFVSTGFAGGNIELATRGKGMGGLVTLQGQEYGVMWYYTALPLQLGAQDFLRLGSADPGDVWVLRFGARATWFQQLAGGWSTMSSKSGDKGRDVRGPPMDASGPGLLLSLAVGVASAPH